MLTLARTLRRAIRSGDDHLIGRAYLRLAARVGSTKALALSHRFWRG